MRKLFTLLTVMLLAIGVRAGEVTVADGTTTNDNLPVYGFYADTGFKTQFIYPAASLTNIEGSTMNAMLFHSAYESVVFPDGEVTVKLAEVEQTTLSAILDDASFQKVYQGSFDVVNGELVFEFSEPYAYAGGNLLVQVELSKKSSKYPYTSFYGITSTGSGYLHTNIDVSRNFLPKVTISFAESASTCPRPSKLACTVTPDGGVFTWEGEAEQYQWCIVEKDAEAAGWALIEAKTYTASGLKADKEYDFYVRTYCSETEQSKEAKISFSPFCKAPEAVEMSNLTHESVLFSWDAVAGIEKYQYVCLRADSAPDWATVDAKAVLTASIDTLQPQTSYAFYVRSWFNAETQSAAVKVAFTTNCVARTLPFSEDFSSGTMPNCWEAGSKWTIDVANDDHTTGGATGFLRYNTGSASDVNSPSIELSEDALLDFFYQNRNNGSAIPFDIIVLDASSDAELLKESVTTVSPSETWVQKTIDLSAFTGKTIKIQFHGNGSKGYIRIDDISVTAKPCVTPKNLKADVATAGATITWTAGGSEAAWNLRHKATDAEEWTVVKDLDEPSYSIAGLVAGTEYQVQVQAACAAEKQSEWTASVLFTPTCPVPTKVAVSAISYDHATVTWESQESVFNLQYKVKDSTEWIVENALEAKSFRLSGLEGNTKYQVKVQAACGGEFSAAVSFTTLCAPLAEAIPFEELFDSVPDNELPACWEKISNSEYPMVLAGSAAYGEEGSCLWFSGTDEQIVVLPLFADDIHNLTLSFFYKMLSANLQVGYLTELRADAFVALADLEVLNSYGTDSYKLALTELVEGAYLAIRYYDTTSEWAKALIDNVKIDNTPTTAIDNTEIRTKATKRIENGMLIIENNGVHYNAQGARVNK